MIASFAGQYLLVLPVVLVLLLGVAWKAYRARR
jgi:hypothetical protein